MVYFVKDTVTQAIKIGYSRDPHGRLGGLQTGNPHKLTLLGTIKGTPYDEASLHARFAQHRLEGEWFKSEIIEDVMEIIAAATKQKTESRRKTVIDPTECKEVRHDGPTPDTTAGNKGASDGDSGIQGVCRIPGLKIKLFVLTLTERPWDGVKGGMACGVQLKYLLVFEKDFTQENAGPTELDKLRTVLFDQHRGLKHTFYDEDNAVIPFFASQPFHCCHIVGGREALTGATGDAFRVLVVFENALNPNASRTVIKDVFTGENYAGEHPLKKAKRMVVSLR